MAKIAGKACVVYVGNAATSASSWTLLEGQTSCSFDGSVSMVDTTDKNNDGWETGTATTRSGKVSVSGSLEDSRAQLDKLEAAWVGSTTYNCKIVFDTAGNGYKGDFYVSLKIDAGVKEVVKYSIDLTPAGALTAVP
jgi:predicted secreted protein